MRKSSVFTAILFLLFLVPSSYAQEPTPCDPCLSSPEGAYTRSSGTAPSGVVHQLSCRNGYWEELPTNLVFDPENTCFTPDPFSFVDAIAEPTTLSESDIVQITGMVDATPISIGGDGSPSYRVCGDASCSTVNHTWSSSGGNIDAGEHLQLQLTSGAAENNVNTATVTIGTDDVAWNVRTIDTSPDAFDFTDQNAAASSTLILSDVVQISGIDDGIAISVSGSGSPSYRLCADSGCSAVNHDWSSSSGTIDSGEYLQLRLTSSASENQTYIATVTVGSGGDSWNVRTADRTPYTFSFTNQNGAPTSTLLSSDIVQISGMDDGTTVSITGDGSPAYRICADAGCSTVNHNWTNSTESIDSGEYLQLRLTSSASDATTSTATITVGNGSSQWDVMTSCSATPSPGDEGCEMADGSIYAGLSPDGNVAMFTTPADAASTYTWNDGSANYTDMSLENCIDGSAFSNGTALSCQTGEANTAYLIGATGEADYPFAAAEYCDNLSAHGHGDWYLPARDELNVLYTHQGVGGLIFQAGYPLGHYWSSSEGSTNGFDERARFIRFSDGLSSGGLTKDTALSIRCVRK